MAREKSNKAIIMNYFLIAHIIVSIILIILITLQEQSSESSGVFGGGGGGGAYQTRRGLEKGFFVATIIFTALFVILALLNLVLPALQNIL